MKALNPVIYSIYNPSFRDACRIFFRKLFKLKGNSIETTATAESIRSKMTEQRTAHG